MNQFTKFTLLLLLSLSLFSCNQKKEAQKVKVEKRKTVEMVTNYGTIVLELYNETPLHRDNFINLTANKAYDSLLFHRVIHNFMIQGGDPDSKKAQVIDTLGEGDVPYKIAAEFRPNLFHKKGVLAAARDGNPERASSGMQFYIVQGKVYNDSLLDTAEKRINTWLAEHDIANDPSHKYLLDSLRSAMVKNNRIVYSHYSDSINTWAKTNKNFHHYTLPENHREIYKTVGGTPHLDQNYTVFGEVVKGLAIVDSIAKVETNDLDRPITDVRIQTIRVIDNNDIEK
tara:strand:+ start:89360 stop:90214 length:855 start_codon:yes stop_codon:yes gene_type:complete